MIKDNRSTAAFSVILALGLWLGYVGFHAARAAEASRIQVEKKRAALEAEIHRLKETIASKRRRLGEFGALRHESPWSVTAGEHPSPTGRNNWSVTARDASMIRMRLAAFQAELPNHYGTFYRSLGLTRAEIEAFEASLTGCEETLYDLHAVAAMDGLDESGPEVAALVKQANEELHAEEAVLLGDAGYRQLQQFYRAEPIQGFMDSIATGFPPEPLTETQAQQLAVVLKNASSGYQDEGPVNPVTVDWSAVLARAEGILSANQLDGLKASINRVKLDQFRRQFFQKRGPP